MVRRKTAGAWSSVCWVPLSNPEASSLFLVRASRLFLVRAPRLFLVRASRLFLGPVLLFPGFNMLIRCLLPCVVLIYAFVLPLCCLVRSWSCATTVYAVHGAGGAPRQAQAQNFVANLLGLRTPAGRSGCPFLPAGMPILTALPCPQTTPGLAGGRRRRHGRCIHA